MSDMRSIILLLGEICNDCLKFIFHEYQVDVPTNKTLTVRAASTINYVFVPFARILKLILLI